MNRLAEETSPYLLQHRDNPVDWYPWGDDAFERSRAEDRPILLSVGYSSCHWCHVMAHESFEDEDTAEVMNRLFVNVKVDREEHPDVDAIYMEATQALTGRGGWPMTVFLTPDGKPFYAGTYFPKDARGGMPSFVELLHAIDEAWSHQRGELEERAEVLTRAIGDAGRLEEAGGIGDAARLEEQGTILAAGALDRVDPIADAAERCRTALDEWIHRAWDPAWGGFGSSPKFPQSAVLEMALRALAGREDPQEDEFHFAVAATSLAGMAAGGIYDHLAGGFARYSTDERWLVPHFEKMLYDQASLSLLYLHGWQVTGDERWLQVCRETIDYVLTDLALDGGFASAEDADSDGEEGAFYLWRAKELHELLDDTLADAIGEFYDVTWKGNATGRMEGGEGANILHRPPGAPLERPPEVDKARRVLLDARSRRNRPGRDDKVLTEWNGMFLSSLTQAAMATASLPWKNAAVSLGEFLLSTLRRPDGRWLRSVQRGRARHLGYATDYAWMVESLTRLGELTGEARWTEEACRTADGLLELFADGDAPGFFTVGRDAPALVVAHKETFDGSTPSANALAASALWRLGSLTGAQRYLDVATGTLAALAPHGARQPAACAYTVGALDLAARGAIEVVVSGRGAIADELVHAAQRSFQPRMVLAWGEPFPSPLWEGRPQEGSGRAYVCEGFTCRQPTSDPAELARLMRAT